MSDIDPSCRPGAKVAAVVVTRNRIAMLRECVHALRQQTCPVGEVFVVDNDSSDGTREWLNQQPDIHVVLQENAGGAGGFHVGIETAISRGFEWVWCMDDDGYPSADCLQALLSIPQDTLRFRAPVVLARGDASLLAFVLRPNPGSAIRTREELDSAASHGLLWGVACPFNGVLIHREIVASIGLPIGGMFLWGDEAEYCMRITRAGYRVATVASALFHHPLDRMTERTFRCLGRELYVVHAGNKLRDYVAIRNRAYILHRYPGLAAAIKHGGRHALFYGRIGGFSGFCWAAGAAWAGIRGEWSGHKAYIE